MKAPKMSNSRAVQNVLADIWGYLEELGPEEVRRYMRAFPRELDYNLVNYGNMRVYYDDIRAMYERAGIRRVSDTYKRAYRDHRAGEHRIGDSELWEMYRGDVRRAAREYIARAAVAEAEGYNRRVEAADGEEG